MKQFCLLTLKGSRLETPPSLCGLSAGWLQTPVSGECGFGGLATLKGRPEERPLEQPKKSLCRKHAANYSSQSEYATTEQQERGRFGHYRYTRDAGDSHLSQILKARRRINRHTVDYFPARAFSSRVINSPG